MHLFALDKLYGTLKRFLEDLKSNEMSYISDNYCRWKLIWLKFLLYVYIEFNKLYLIENLKILERRGMKSPNNTSLCILLQMICIIQILFVSAKLTS